MLLDKSQVPQRNEEFRQYFQTKRGSSINLPAGLEIIQLVGYDWPENSFITAQPSSIVRSWIETYEEYTRSRGRNTNAILKWVINKGTAVLKYQSKEGKKFTLDANIVQMVILTMFNNANEVRFGDIVNELKAYSREDENKIADQIKFALEELGNNFLKLPGQGALNPSDIITFNNDVTFQRLKVDIRPKIRRGEKEVDNIDPEVEKQRKNLIKCYVVRSMKGRKIATLNTITEDVIRMATHFRPEPRMIKSVVEILLGGNVEMSEAYLRRCEDEPGKFEYVP
eukprot:TRINITY_DN11840_c0_g2_i1.p1 TRINITY_DN11840_c0_g2~~TRINITY_DN11840_c0_g2_i1.p1  ORF type:complete len:283 (-),score=70.14 TRINITY_DN11840_c0_g2_i1:181-1029(-)